ELNIAESNRAEAAILGFDQVFALLKALPFHPGDRNLQAELDAFDQCQTRKDVTSDNVLHHGNRGRNRTILYVTALDDERLEAIVDHQGRGPGEVTLDAASASRSQEVTCPWRGVESLHADF